MVACVSRGISSIRSSWEILYQRRFPNRFMRWSSHFAPQHTNGLIWTCWYTDTTLFEIAHAVLKASWSVEMKHCIIRCLLCRILTSRGLRCYPEMLDHSECSCPYKFHNGSFFFSVYNLSSSWTLLMWIQDVLFQTNGVVFPLTNYTSFPHSHCVRVTAASATNTYKKLAEFTWCRQVKSNMSVIVSRCGAGHWCEVSVCTSMLKWMHQKAATSCINLVAAPFYFSVPWIISSGAPHPHRKHRMWTPQVVTCGWIQMRVSFVCMDSLCMSSCVDNMNQRWPLASAHIALIIQGGCCCLFFY